MKRLFILPVLLLMLHAFSNAQTSSSFVSGKVQFTIKNMGLNVNGTMNITAIQFNQPSSDPKTWSIQGSADPATISTGIDLRDKHLKKSDYFNVVQYPFIRLQSTAIKSKGKNAYEGIFTLTLKDITKTVIIPFYISKQNHTSNIEGEFMINRLEFKLGEESSILADKVKIKVSAVFKPL